MSSSIAERGPTTLWESTDQGTTWQPSAVPFPVPAGQFPVDVATLGSSTLYVTTATDSGPGSDLLTTNDAGRSWTVQPTPCGGADVGESPVSALSSSELWLICAGGPGAGNQGKSVYRSSDGGARWTLEAMVVIGGEPTVGSISSGGYVNQLTAVTDTTAYLGLNRGTLLPTTDGGGTWHNVMPEGGDDQTYFNMLTPTMGVAMVDGGAWHTTNGSTWTSSGT